jgi:hypothetical protein
MENELNDLMPDDLNDQDGGYLPNNLIRIDEDENDIYGSLNNHSGAKFLAKNKGSPP